MSNCLGGEGLESEVLVSPCPVKCVEKRMHQVERGRGGGVRGLSCDQLKNPWGTNQ